MHEYFAVFGLPGTFVLTWLISLVAVILALLRRQKYAYFCAAAMVISSCADMFMTRFGRIPELFPNYFIIGAALFMVAHVLYAVSYRTLAKSKGYRYFNGGVITAIVIALACVAYFTVVCAQRSDFSMFFLCMLYLIVIIGNCAAVFSYAWSAAKKKPYLVLCAVGALSFFVSDLCIGLEVLAGIYDYSFLVWWFYPIGQILLNVFAL